MNDISDKNDRSRRFTMVQMARFYIPLAANSFLMGLSHNIINAGIARTANPEMGFAAYKIAKSLAMVVENPVFMVRQTTVSLVNGARSFRFIHRAFALMAAVIALVLLLIGATPIGGVVFVRFFGASPEIAASARMAMGVLFLLPLATTNRNVFQGVAVICHRTNLIPLATVCRIVFLVVVNWFLLRIEGLPGAVLGSILFVGGLGVEFIVTFLCTRDAVGQLDRSWSTTFTGAGCAEVHAGESGAAGASRAGVRTAKVSPAGASHAGESPVGAGPAGVDSSATVVTLGVIVAFFAPLALTSFIQNATLPLVHTRIGFGALRDPGLSIAAFAAGSELSNLLSSPIGALHQAAIVFADDEDPAVRTLLRRFTIGFVALVAFVSFFVSFTSVGMIVLERWIGVSHELASRAIAVLKIMSFVIAVRGVREYLWGLSMKRRQTGIIGTAKSEGLVVTVILTAVGIRLLDWYPSAVVAAALAMGEVVETLQVFWRLGGISLQAKGGNRHGTKAISLQS